MLVTLLVVAGLATAAALVVLLPLGRRWPQDGVLRALVLATPATVVTGELAARGLGLPSDQVVAAEAVLVAAAAAVAGARRRWNPPGVWFLACLLVAEGAYLAYAAQVTVAGGLEPGAVVVSAALWLLEAAGLVLAASFAFETCDVVCRTGWDRPTEPPATGYLPFVSIHVAAYNEPPDMLIETIRSLEALDYPDLEIVVVDNNTDDAEVWKPVEEYCGDRPWIRFVHVAPWPGYKAGALNLALDEHTDHRAEVVAIVDADYLVDREWLRDLVGWFANPRVGFVQGPQDYDEWAGDAYLTACHDAYAYFFAASMRSRNERNSAIFGGTMGLIRRSALDEIGGWDEWCITEDAEASLRLYAAGYAGVYVHRSYGRGIMPLTFDALKRQRFRWCFGGIQILRRHARLLLPWPRHRDDYLTPVQRLDFLMGGLQWGTDLVALGYTGVLAASVATLLTGGELGFRPLGGPAIVLPMALALAGTVRAVWALRVLQGISLRRAALAFANWLSLSLTVAKAVIRGLVQRDGVFLRTPKWRHDGGLIEALRAARTESVLAAGLVVGAVVAGVQGRVALAVLALWQSCTYAAAPAMAWLNLHTELSARLQRRHRGEDRRERLASYEARLARAATAAVVVACVAFAALVARYPGDGTPVHLPRRGSHDAGPLGNVGILADDEDPVGARTTTAAPTSTSGPAPVTPAGPDDPTGPHGGDGAATPTSRPAITTTAVPAAPTTTLSPAVTSPGVGTRPTTPTPPGGGPPTSHPIGGP
ncbi:MAG TPA: glycosyltransferase [Acidimicrobiales bacterium]|nr:glycosyltransferase [Acidimicrobiales bacterium]